MSGSNLSKIMRVGINAHLLSGEAGYRRAGIHQYIYQVLRHLPTTEAGLEAVVFTRLTAGLRRPGLTLVTTRWPTARRVVRIAWEQMQWPWLAARYRLDLLHSMAFVLPWLALSPGVVTVYDLSFMLYPERFPAGQRRYLQSQTAQACRRARRVITISESSRQDVSRLFGTPLAAIDVIWPGVDGAVFRPLPAADVAAFRQREGLPERFVLHVGTLQPRKNIPVLLEAMAQLAGETAVPLVLTGGKGWLFDEIFARVTDLGLTHRVRFTGYVPDEDLPLWYNAATALAFPSVYEGFGLPVVEAMSCGTPVIAANVSSIPEAAGEAALLFDPHDPTALAACLTAVLQHPDLVDDLRHKGLSQAGQFSWVRAGRETAVTYQHALGQI